MKADSAIILVLVFSVITIAVWGIIGEMNNNYNINISKTWQDQYNSTITKEINKSIYDIQKDAEAVGDEKGWLSVLSGASAIWQGLKTTVLTILATPKYVLQTVRKIAFEMGLPSIVSNVIIPIFVVIIAIAIIFIIVRMIRGESV